MESTHTEKLVKKIEVAFMEREPEFIQTTNPYTASKFYKDMADSDISLYTKQDYNRLYKLLASVALYNGKIEKTEKHGCVIDFVFCFSSKGNYEEFLDSITKHN